MGIQRRERSDNTYESTGNGEMRKIRVLMTKIGFDAHDRGAKVVASALREAGMEVIYTGPWQSIDEVVEASLQEDVDVIGVSSLAYDHLLIPKLMAGLRERGLWDILVVAGGVIPEQDVPTLQEAGVAKVFPPGTSLDEIVKFIQEAVRDHHSKKEASTSQGPGVRGQGSGKL
ncbi:MAG: cobalamin B12-binding domain-containing protein [Candidatus Binatia bacterium]